MRNRRYFPAAVRFLFSHAVRILASAAVMNLCLTADAVAGRGDKAGTAAANELLIPIGARGVSLGGSSLATVEGLEAIFWNPAGLVRSNFPSAAMVSHMKYLDDIGVDYLGVCTDLGDFGKLGLSIKSLSFGSIPITTEDAPDGTGEVANPADYVLGATIARLVTDHIAFGVNGNYIIEEMDKTSATGFAFTAGIQYRGLGGIDDLSVGVVIRNLGSQIKYSGDGLTRNATIDDNLRPSSEVKIEAASNDLPSTIEIGLGYVSTIADNSVMNFTSTFQNNNYSDDAYKFGAEYVYEKFLAFRGGYTYVATEASALSIFGPSFGFGVVTSVEGANVAIDYSYSAVRFFGANHIIALTVGF